MTIPNYQELMLPILQLAASGETSVKAATQHIMAKQHKSPDKEKDTIGPVARRAYILGRANWALFCLFKAGLLHRLRRGHYNITKKGRQLLATKPKSINNEFLLQYPEYKKWCSQRVPSQKATQINPEAPKTETQTPEERIDNAYEERLNMLHDEVLQRLLDMHPLFFEVVVIKLLVAMGYGGALEDAGEHIGGSDDEGIDGIIKEDKLGLEKIYIQAKRYIPKNSIGRPILEQFVGSLTRKSARKGVFVTTSSFSDAAREYVKDIDKSLVLIDGEELARLMVEHDLGMRTSRTIELKEIDESFFQDED